MIGPGDDARVMVATKPIDFLKGADSLAALVKAEYGANRSRVVRSPHRCWLTTGAGADSLGPCWSRRPFPTIPRCSRRCSSKHVARSPSAIRGSLRGTRRSPRCGPSALKPMEIERLTGVIAALQRHRFGARSEQLSEDQLSLAFEETEAALARVAAKLGSVTPDRGMHSVDALYFGATDATRLARRLRVVAVELSIPTATAREVVSADGLKSAR